MVTTPYIIRDENFYLSDREYRSSFKQSEINMYKWNIQYRVAQPIYTDPIQNIRNLRLLYDLNTTNVRYYTGSGVERFSTVTLRNYMIDKGTITYSDTFGISHDFNTPDFVIRISVLDVIFSNNGGNIYYSP